MHNLSSSDNPETDTIFLAGAAKVDITPPMGTILGVDFVMHYARFIHDPLHAKAVVLKNREQMMAIVIVDICIMDTDLMEDIKAGILQKTGIRRENILLASNHNHASGDVVGLLGGAVDINYRKKLPALVVQSVEDAFKNLRPARTASGSAEVPDYVVCRRYFMKEGFASRNPVSGEPDKVKTNPAGAEHMIKGRDGVADPGLGFLAVRGLDGEWIAVLGNYSLHYAADWHVDSVTADYFGEFSRQIKEKLKAGDGFVGIMSNGTSGDINIWDFMAPQRLPMGDYERTKLIGSVLSDKVAGALRDISWDDAPSLSSGYLETELRIRKPSLAELEAAARDFSEKDFNCISMDDEGIRQIYAREQLLLNEYPDTHISPVQAFRIGNLVIGALGGEFFAETGLALKSSMKGVNYFSICLANAYGGYIPPEHEFENGGYETWRARSSFMEEGAEGILRKKMTALVGELIRK